MKADLLFVEADLFDKNCLYIQYWTTNQGASPRTRQGQTRATAAQGMPPPMNPRSTSRPPRFPRVTKTLRPHQPGTLKLTRRYGGELLCVRYREDALGRRRCTTVELIIDEGPVQRRLSERSLVTVKIPWQDHKIRARAIALRARWDSETKTWRMSLRTALSLGLQDQIIPPPRNLATLGKVR